MRFLVVTFILILPTLVAAQKIKLTKGSIDVLKGQKEIALQFSYDSLTVGLDVEEKFFVELKKKDWNYKEAGKGDAFEQYWYGSRKSLYESMFRFQFNKTSALPVAKTTAPYTLIVKTKFIEPGWNAGVVTKAPIIAGEAWIVSSNEPLNPIAIITFEKCSGENVLGGDFEMGQRIQSAYYTAGIALAKFVNKKLDR